MRWIVWRPVALVLFVCLVALPCVAAYYASRLTGGFDLRVMLPKKHYMVDFLDLEENLLSDRGPMTAVYTGGGGLSFSDLEVPPIRRTQI